MPLRISESWRTSTVSNFAPRWSRIATARLEKPHCGNNAVPFMNRTTSAELAISPMRALVSVIGLSSFRRCGGELEGVENTAHAPAERLVNHSVLLRPRLASKRLGDHSRRIMVAVAGKVGDLDLRAGDGG